MHQLTLIAVADPVWVNVLRAEAEKPNRTKKAIADELGVSRTAISLLCTGTYNDKAKSGLNKLQAKIAHKVMALYGAQVWCPHQRNAVTPTTCETHRTAPMSTSDPVKLRQWAACRACPQNPEKHKKAEVANAV